MENKHSIKKNYILNLAYQILAVCVPIVTTPYVSRTLQADGIGAYSYTLSIATYFSMFAALGYIYIWAIVNSKKQKRQTIM